MNSRQKLVVVVAIFGLVSCYPSQARKKPSGHSKHTKAPHLKLDAELVECLNDPTEPLMEDPTCGYDKIKRINTTFSSLEEFERASSSNKNLVFKKSDYCSQVHLEKYCGYKFKLNLFTGDSYVCAETPGNDNSELTGPRSTYLHTCHFFVLKICYKHPNWKIIQKGMCPEHTPSALLE